VKKKITYEQPLNDRIRYFLRLEYLFEGLYYGLKGPTVWDSRHTLGWLNELLELLTRLELRHELLNDLEQHQHRLERWRTLPKVDTERLGQLQQQAQHCHQQLTNYDSTYPEQLSQYALLTAVRQRGSISGGCAPTDLASYHFWLNQPPKQRVDTLIEWLTPLEALRHAIEFTLYLLRNNALKTQERAHAGYYQSTLEAIAQGEYQLIQVHLPDDHACYPEINGGKQRFSIRFYEQPHAKERPQQTPQDVNFELSCCLL
jgi:cell division protein ZapD